LKKPLQGREVSLLLFAGRQQLCFDAAARRSQAHWMKAILVQNTGGMGAITDPSGD